MNVKKTKSSKKIVLKITMSMTRPRIRHKLMAMEGNRRRGPCGVVGEAAGCRTSDSYCSCSRNGQMDRGFSVPEFYVALGAAEVWVNATGRECVIIVCDLLRRSMFRFVAVLLSTGGWLF